MDQILTSVTTYLYIQMKPNLTLSVIPFPFVQKFYREAAEVKTELSNICIQGFEYICGWICLVVTEDPIWSCN